ncbi:MAG: hypothetical protein FWE17_02490, partial [Alphaproteobacteria bacterium]|nr:hypothetical protein [Alphaproteobacteria bacterium]
MKPNIYTARGVLLATVILFPTLSNANEIPLSQAIANAREECVGISSELNRMKTMAGIGTAVGGVGTLAAGGAAYAGFARARVDREISSLQAMAEINNREPGAVTFAPDIREQIAAGVRELAFDDEPVDSRLQELEDRSRTLGHWRTGLMAGSTATNVAGAVIAGGNRVRGDLRSQIRACINATNAVQRAAMQERMNHNPDNAMIARANNIVERCGEWVTVDVSSINDRASGAMTASIVGAGAGAAGTIASAQANTNRVREDRTEEGQRRGTNLNTTANVLAVATGVASLTATVFSATQIRVINRASSVSDACENSF